jgi:hypothetical protein
LVHALRAISARISVQAKPISIGFPIDHSLPLVNDSPCTA